MEQLLTLICQRDNNPYLQPLLGLISSEEILVVYSESDNIISLLKDLHTHYEIVFFGWLETPSRERLEEHLESYPQDKICYGKMKSSCPALLQNPDSDDLITEAFETVYPEWGWSDGSGQTIKILNADKIGAST
jgi:hypothetical protein